MDAGYGEGFGHVQKKQNMELRYTDLDFTFARTSGETCARADKQHRPSVPLQVYATGTVVDKLEPALARKAGRSRWALCVYVEPGANEGVGWSGVDPGGGVGKADRAGWGVRPGSGESDDQRA